MIRLLRFFTAALTVALGCVLLTLPIYTIGTSIYRNFTPPPTPSAPTIPYQPTLQAGWTVTGPQTIRSGGELFGCSPMRILEWGPTGSDWAVVATACVDPPSAGQALNNIEARTLKRPGSAIFRNADINFIMAPYLMKGWAQDRYLVLVGSKCDTDECRRDLDNLARELAARFPGEPRNVGTGGIITLILALTLVAVISLATPRLVQRLRRQKLYSPTFLPHPAGGTAYGDDTRAVRRTTRAFVWTRRLLLWMAVTGVLTLGAITSHRAGDPLVLPIAVAVFFVLTLIAHLVVRRRIPKLPAIPKVFSRRPRRKIGQGITDGIQILVIIWFVMLLLSVTAAIVSSDQPLSQAVSYFRIHGGPWPHPTAIFGTIKLTFTQFPLLGTCLYLLLPPALLVLIERFGLRLAAPTSDELLAADQRPPVLYLRSFDEDSLTLNASISERGLTHRLMPWRSRRFEEFLAGELSRIGPVVAISPPGTRVAPLGAARMTLGGDEWQSRVHDLTQRSAAIVMSATPSSIREGLHWEISYLGTQTAHGRVMLVVAPWRKEEVARRLGNFIHVASAFPLFAGLPLVPPTEGVHALWRDGAGNWRSVGAQYRSDVSYRTILARVVEENWRMWYGGIPQQNGPTRRNWWAWWNR